MDFCISSCETDCTFLPASDRRTKKTKCLYRGRRGRVEGEGWKNGKGDGRREGMKIGLITTTLWGKVTPLKIAHIHERLTGGAPNLTKRSHDSTAGLCSCNCKLVTSTVISGKKQVLSRERNDLGDWAERIDTEAEFQKVGPATEKARSPSRAYTVLATTRDLDFQMKSLNNDKSEGSGKPVKTHPRISSCAISCWF